MDPFESRGCIAREMVRVRRMKVWNRACRYYRCIVYYLALFLWGFAWENVSWMNQMRKRRRRGRWERW